MFEKKKKKKKKKKKMKTIWHRFFLHIVKVIIFSIDFTSELKQQVFGFIYLFILL